MAQRFPPLAVNPASLPAPRRPNALPRLVGSIRLLAFSLACACAAVPTPGGSDGPAAPAIPVVPDPVNSAWISVTAELESWAQDQQTPVIQVYSISSGSTPIALTVATTAFGLGSDPAAGTIGSFRASMAYLQSQSPGLSLSDRRLVLSEIGRRLSNGYSATMRNNPSMEAIFQNARQGSDEGGICGDIHTYLSLTAPHLGFDSSGAQHVYWKISNSSGGGHVVAHYRDPSTGEYYMQNYEDLFATGQKTLPNLLEVSTRILGIYLGGSSVESQPGTMHLYVPRQARWVMDAVMESATSPIGAPYVRAALGNRQESASAQYGWRFGGHQVKAFSLYARDQADEGTYDCAAIGMAYTVEGTVPVRRPWLASAGVRATGYASWLTTDMPLFRPVAGQATLRPVPCHASVFHWGSSLRAFLEQGRTSETAELDWRETPGISSSDREARFSIDHALASLPLHVYLQRAWQLVAPNGFPNKPPMHCITAYDRSGARLNLEPVPGLSLGLNADYLALGGIGSNAGTAVQLGFSATLETRHAGTFSLADDWGHVVGNSKRDPFYAVPASHFAVVAWRRALSRHSSLRIQTAYGEGPSVQPFGIFGPARPGLNDGSRQLSGIVAFDISR